jgi:hypothetical protein
LCIIKKKKKKREIKEEEEEKQKTELLFKVIGNHSQSPINSDDPFSGATFHMYLFKDVFLFLKSKSLI